MRPNQKIKKNNFIPVSLVGIVYHLQPLIRGHLLTVRKSVSQRLSKAKRCCFTTKEYETEKLEKRIPLDCAPENITKTETRLAEDSVKKL